jgi:hypothetical protein
MIPHRTLNCIEGFVGARNMGKTHLKTQRVRARIGQGYIFSHDPQHQIQSKIVCYSVFEAAQAVRKGMTKDLIVCRVPDGAQVIRLARFVAQQSIARAHKERTYPNVWPVFLDLDEAVLTLGIQPNRLSPEAAELFTQCRHEHIALYWGTQTPNRVHYELINQSTRMHFFRCVGGQAAARMKEATIPEDVIAQVQSLRKHSYVLCAPGNSQSHLVECRCGANHDDEDLRLT